jgi:hypothetical protein
MCFGLLSLSIYRLVNSGLFNAQILMKNSVDRTYYFIQYKKQTPSLPNRYSNRRIDFSRPRATLLVINLVRYLIRR